MCDIHINACNRFITWPLAQDMVDKARNAGYPKSVLRWRVGVAQMRGIQVYLAMLSNKEDVQRYEAEFGNGDTGMLAGVPFYCDATVAPGEIFLEVISGIATIGRIGALAVPVGYEVEG